MPREKESYRDNLERLNERYPDKELLTVTDVANFLGICRQRAKAMLPFKEIGGAPGVTKASLARFLSI